jgi:TonB family protein
LGTLAFHLFLLVIFLSVRLSEAKKEYNRVMLIEFTEEPSPLEEIQQKKEMEERVNNAAENFIRRNIGVNVAEKIEEELSTEKFEEQFKKQLNEANPDRMTPEDIAALREEFEKGEVASIDKTKPSKGNKNPYMGPTNIEYYLPGRDDMNLYVPVYLCEGNGKVTINIQVDQKGFVTAASVSGKSEARDECLFEAALEAAKLSRFSVDLNAEPDQRGTITYHFVAQ